MRSWVREMWKKDRETRAWTAAHEEQMGEALKSQRRQRAFDTANPVVPGSSREYLQYEEDWQNPEAIPRKEPKPFNPEETPHRPNVGRQKPTRTAFQKISIAAKRRVGRPLRKKINAAQEVRAAKRMGPPLPAREPGWLLKQFKKNPTGAVLGAGNLALMFGPGLVKSLRDELDIGGYVDEQTDRLIGAQAELNSYARMQRRREEELNRLMQVNTAMLAQRSPELYNQIMAGRRLPQQATVIGGQPREDLLREVARGMSEGRYGTPEEMMGG